MDDLPVEGVWRAALETLENRVPPEDFRQYLQPLVAVARGNDLVLETQSWSALEALAQRYLTLLTETVRQVAGRDVTVRLQAPRRTEQQELFPAGTATRPPKARAPGSRGIDGLTARYTFDQFVVGASNQFAHAACKAVASQPGERYNPLFLYGGVGLGKSHLVTAIGHEILSRDPAKRVVYLSAESFMNELISALRRDRMDDFKNRFRRVDVLILDDVQFLSGRERTQEEFFHTFNSLHESHRQIVLTSDKFPKEIPDLEERLRNRFEWGLIADIQPPDVETRVAILEKKAEVEHLDLPHDVAIFLADQIDSNVRELEGSLTRLGAFASLQRAPITVDFARQVLATVLQPKRNEITIETIQQIVCDFFDLRPAELRSKKRTQNLAVPRQLAMYLCRRYTQASYPVIGDRFGGRDHSTVIHAMGTIERRIREDVGFRATVERLERLLSSSGG